MKTLKVDLHVHSSHSNKPTIWALRKFNCPESYTSPAVLYRTAREQGMDFVTITDHNSIGGALEIAHLPDVFVSCEITAYFPEDNCKVHVVVLNITEAQFGELMRVRKNIYELVALLNREGIAHFIAHPLYAQNERLTAGHIEKMMLLFNVVEVRNGSRAGRFNRFMERIITSLTPARIEELANLHDLAPCGPTPWLKGMVGGSDDHSGLFIGRSHTSVLHGNSVEDFIAAVKNRQSRPEGDDGDPLTLAHSLYGIGHSFYRERFKSRMDSSTPFIKALLDRFFDSGADRMTLLEKVKLLVRRHLPEGKSGYEDRTFEEILDREAKRLLNDQAFLTSIGAADRNRKIFAVTSYLANRMIYIYTEKLARTTLGEGFFGVVNSLGTIGLVHLLVSPYYLAFHHQHRSKALMAELGERFLPESAGKAEKIVLFTDTLHEINGVAITIKRLVQTARQRGVSLTVVSSSPEPTGFADGVMNFRQIGDFTLPEYPELRLHFPPILDIMDYVEREGFTRIHISTPGTVGLLGLAIGRLMDIPVYGTYHTEIPQYVGRLTDDEFLEKAAWSYMIWFYGQMEEVLVPSASTRDQLIRHGLAAEKTRPLPRWVDTDAYTPARRDDRLWVRLGLSRMPTLLYVGRVSKEKNLELLADAFLHLMNADVPCQLVIVGDGPYRAEMEQLLAGLPALFTGYLAGERLQAAYASADLFVFPSTTDTFGNVVLEAQASGLPVIVSDRGGPQELMRAGETGIVIAADSQADLTDALLTLLRDPARRTAMGEAARRFTEEGALAAGETYSTILRERYVVNG